MASLIRLGVGMRIGCRSQQALRAPAFSRPFTATAVSKKDLIQDLYISQLKSYKPAPQAKDAHSGVVRNYNAPTPPKAPALPSDLAGELAKFDAQEPSLGGSTARKAAASTESEGENADEYLSFLEKDLPKPEAHH